jgi:hypothetical protein
MTHHRLLTLFAAPVAAVALGVPAALAGPGPGPAFRPATQPVAPLQRGPDERTPLGIYAPGTLGGPVDGRSPDTVDAAIQAHGSTGSPATVTLTSPTGFAWGDFGVGVGAALAAALLALGTITARRQTGRPATA